MFIHGKTGRIPSSSLLCLTTRVQILSQDISSPLKSILRGEEYHSAAKEKARTIHWRRMVTSPSGSPEYCNTISKVCLHQLMALQWIILPLFQLFLHGGSHSKDRSLGICRKCYNFPGFFLEWTDHSVGLKNHWKLLEVTCLQRTVPNLWLQKIGSEHAEPGISSRSRRTQEQEGKAMEEKHMNSFVPAEDFWASPLITWIMKTSGVPSQCLKMKLSSLCMYVKP